MRPALLAIDFDGTIKDHGRHVDGRLVERLAAVRKAGTLVVLVTGRCLPELEELIDTSVFDAIVAENGTILVIGSKKTLLAPEGWATIRAGLLAHFAKGCEEVVISLDREEEANAARLVGGRAKIELNKDKIMIMPQGIDKASGLAAAVKRLGLKGTIASVGDGENDLALFRASDYRIALQNSVESLKKEADYVSSLPDGEGLAEAIDRLFPPQKGRQSLERPGLEEGP